jgi:hypothetical protein
VQRTDDFRGARGAQRGGMPSLASSCGSRVARGLVLCSGLLGPRSPALSSKRPSPQAVVGSKRRPQAAFRSEGGFRSRVLRRACSAVQLTSEGLSRLAAFVVSSSRGEGRAASRRRESERRFDANCVKYAVASNDGREPDARECVRASEVQLQKSLGGSLIQRSAGRRSA